MFFRDIFPAHMHAVFLSVIGSPDLKSLCPREIIMMTIHNPRVTAHCILNAFFLLLDMCSSSQVLRVRKKASRAVCYRAGPVIQTLWIIHLGRTRAAQWGLTLELAAVPNKSKGCLRISMCDVNLDEGCAKNVITLTPSEEDISGQLGSRPGLARSVCRISMSNAENLQLRWVEGYIAKGTVNRCGGNWHLFL